MGVRPLSSSVGVGVRSFDVVYRAEYASLKRLAFLLTRSDEEAEDVVQVELLELRDALCRLRPRQRLAVVLRYYLDLSFDEVAAAIGCRPATARSLVHRALGELREVLR